MQSSRADGVKAPGFFDSIRAQAHDRLARIDAQIAELGAERTRVLQLLSVAGGEEPAPSPVVVSALQSADTDAVAEVPEPPHATKRAGRATVPQRLLDLVDTDPTHDWTIREITDHLYGPDATRSTFEGVRKAALRLVERGELLRVGASGYRAATRQGVSA